MRGVFEQFTAGDPEALFSRLTDDFVVADAMVVEDTTGGRGPDALRQNLARIAEAFERVDYELREFSEAGDRVLIRVGVHARGASSELDLDGEVGQVWTMRGDRASRLEVYPSWDEACRAAGL
jgi:ketosteroid isomerase-like protein